jgi:hypothetical protein
MFTFIETRLFSRLADELLGDEGLRALQLHLMRHPGSGVLLRHSGGMRKVRWALPGRGKSGGVRVIYYLHREQEQIWLLTLYPKNVADSIPAHILRKIREEIEGED